MKADLHNHLRTDSRMHLLNFDGVLNIAKKRLEYSSMIGLVNYKDQRFEDFCKLSSRFYKSEDLRNAIYIPIHNMVIIKGQEIPTEQGDLLVIGLKKDVHLKNGKSLDDTLKEAKDKDGITICCYENINHLKEHLEILEEVDAIETFNGEAELWIPGITEKNANEKAEEFYIQAKKNYPHLGKLITSDGHSLYELGRSWMKIPHISLNSEEELNESIRKGLRLSKESKKSKLIGTLGAIEHAFNLAYCIGLTKIGIDPNHGIVPEELTR